MPSVKAHLNLGPGINLIADTATGTKIGTAIAQKLGFWGATPVTQPGNNSDIKDALVLLGLLAGGGVTSLNLDGGTLTAAVVKAGSAVLSDTALTQANGDQFFFNASGNVFIFESPLYLYDRLEFYTTDLYSRTKTSVYFRISTDATPVELTKNGALPGTGNRILVPLGDSIACTITVSARRTTDGASAMFKRMVMITNVTNVVAITGSVQTIGVDINPLNWGLTVQADSTNGSLQIIGTGAAANNIRWTATVESVISTS